MDLLITDVTEMHGSNYCVAGWDGAEGRMVRPLPNGANWTEALLATHAIAPATTIRLTATARRLGGSFPHLTEDVPVDPASIRRVGQMAAGWFGPGAPPCSTTLDAAFAGHLRHNREWRGYLQGAHVAVGARTRSLWAVVVERRGFRFEEDSNKLKALFADGDRRYRLAVSSHSLRDSWRIVGIGGLNGTLPARGRLHLRVGLARAFGDSPDKCYAMINGVFW